MDLRISSKLPISDVQKAFSNTFPYLKVEFSKDPDSTEEPDITISKKVSPKSEQTEEASISITGDMKVRELERALETLFPMHVQVFRLSGNIWLETAMTDDWTLAHQNEQGREISFSANKAAEQDHNKRAV